MTVRIEKKKQDRETTAYFLVYLQRIFAEIVTCDVTPTSVLAFVSALRSPPNFLLLEYGYKKCRTRAEEQEWSKIKKQTITVRIDS